MTYSRPVCRWLCRWVFRVCSPLHGLHFCVCVCGKQQMPVCSGWQQMTLIVTADVEDFYSYYISAHLLPHVLHISRGWQRIFMSHFIRASCNSFLEVKKHLKQWFCQGRHVVSMVFMKCNTIRRHWRERFRCELWSDISFTGTVWIHLTWNVTPENSQFFTFFTVIVKIAEWDAERLVTKWFVRSEICV